VPAGAGTVPPASELTFFLDRNLGSQIVPGALRAAGWVLETMDERGAEQPGGDPGDRPAHQRDLHDGEWISPHGILVTWPSRTAANLAAGQALAR
jgi:hypothetical protein